MEEISGLTPEVEQALAAFTESAKSSLGDDLIAMVLFGSAAQGRMRRTSDVNLILVLRAFSKDRIEALRSAYRVARAAARLQLMFLLKDEIEAAVMQFPLKFSEIIKHHKILCGEDVFSGMQVPSQAIREGIEQTLLNVTIRLRERYALLSLREEQLARALADAAAPLRAAASGIMRLKGTECESPKAALQELIASQNKPHLTGVLQEISKARESAELEPEEVKQAFLGLMELPQILLEQLKNV